LFCPGNQAKKRNLMLVVFQHKNTLFFREKKRITENFRRKSKKHLKNFVLCLAQAREEIFVATKNHKSHQ
jgi:MFS superfamily sulfate permease-like transporter